jgi:hypothetical protein
MILTMGSIHAQVVFDGLEKIPFALSVFQTIRIAEKPELKTWATEEKLIQKSLVRPSSTPVSWLLLKWLTRDLP